MSETQSTQQAPASWQDIRPRRIYWSDGQFKIDTGGSIDSATASALADQLRQLEGVEGTTTGYCGFPQITFTVSHDYDEKDVLARVHGLVKPRYTGDCELVILHNGSSTHFQVRLMLDERPVTFLDKGLLLARMLTTSGVANIKGAGDDNTIDILLAAFHAKDRVRAERVGHRVADALGLYVVDVTTAQGHESLEEALLASGLGDFLGGGVPGASSSHPFAAHFERYHG